MILRGVFFLNDPQRSWPVLCPLLVHLLVNPGTGHDPERSCDESRVVHPPMLGHQPETISSLQGPAGTFPLCLCWHHTNAVHNIVVRVTNRAKRLKTRGWPLFVDTRSEKIEGHVRTAEKTEGHVRTAGLLDGLELCQTPLPLWIVGSCYLRCGI